MCSGQLPDAERDRLVHKGILKTGRFEYHDYTIAASHVLAIAYASVFGVVLGIEVLVGKAIWTHWIGGQSSNRDPCDGVQVGLVGQAN